MNRIAPLVVTLWIAAVTWQWACGPLRPDYRFMLPQGRSFTGLSPAGELMLMKDKGPLEFWSIPDLRMVRGAFLATDEINAYYHDSDGRTLIGRGGRVFLANLTTGEVLDELPGIDPALKGERAFRGDRLIWRGKETLSIYDLISKRFIAEHPTQLLPLTASKNFAMTRTYSQNAAGTSVRHINLIDLQTGRLDSRFDPLGPIDHITISPNERFAVVTQVSMNSICEFRSGKVLWKTPHLNCQYFFRFEDEDEVIAADVTDGNGRVHAARWRAANGQVLNAPPREIVGPATHLPLGATRFAVDCAWQKKSNGRSWVDHEVERVRLSMGLKARWFLDSARCTTVVDLHSGQSLGRLSGEQLWTDALPDGRGVISADINELERGPFNVYLLPQSSDWGWLIRWALLPPASMALLSRWWRRNRSATAVSAV